MVHIYYIICSKLVGELDNRQQLRTAVTLSFSGISIPSGINHDKAVSSCFTRPLFPLDRAENVRIESWLWTGPWEWWGSNVKYISLIRYSYRRSGSYLFTVSKYEFLLGDLHQSILNVWILPSNNYCSLPLLLSSSKPLDTCELMVVRLL